MVGNIGVLKHCVTGRDEWPDVGSTLGDQGDQGHPIHRAWHVNVGEQHRDLIGSGFQKPERCIGIGRLQNLEASLFQHIDRVHAEIGSSSTTRT